MILAKFKTNCNNFHPITEQPKHPYWCIGYIGSQEYAKMIAYADDTDYILENWPDAIDIDEEEVQCYTFNERCPKPDNFKE
jgi:hypothetical protein